MDRLRQVIVALLMVAFFAVLGAPAATPAVLVEDTNRLGVNTYSSPENFVELGNGRVIFWATTRETGRELWSTDGTSAGTTFVRDVVPGSSGATPNGVALTGNLAFFVVLRSLNSEIWSTDGTTEGTRLRLNVQGFSARILRGLNGRALIVCRVNNVTGLYAFTEDLSPPTLVHSGISSVGGAVTFNNALVFVASGPGVPSQLWRTDGTSAGTQPLGGGTNPGWITVTPSAVYFVGSQAATGSELWRSDGTPGGTALVSDLNPGTRGAAISRVWAVGDSVYFFAPNYPSATADYVYTTGPGSAVGLLQPPIGLLPAPARNVTASYQQGTGWCAFITDATDPSVTGHWFWTHDGPSSPAVRRFRVPSSAEYLGELNGVPLFQTGTSVSTIDPSTGLATPLAAMTVDIRTPTAWYGYATLTDGRRYLRIDGTPAGTLEVADKVRNSLMIASDGRIYAQRQDEFGPEPWIIEGPPFSRRLLRDIDPATQDRLTSINFVLNGTFYYVTVSESGLTAYANRGAPSGPPVWQVLFPPPGPGASSPTATVLPGTGRVFIAATRYYAAWTGNNYVWAWDGVSASPQLIHSGAPADAGDLSLQSLGQFMYIRAGSSLLRSDGSPAGTEQFATVPDFWTPVGTVGDRYVYFGNAQFFSIPAELRAIDANTGESQTIGLFPTPIYSRPAMQAGGRLYFRVWQNSGTDQLWVTDGTATGTRMVSTAVQWVLGAIGDDVLYFNNGLHRTINGGTGTQLVSTVLPSSSSGGEQERASYAGHFYFMGRDISDAAGTELWQTDGTQAGTRRTADLTPGSGSTSFNSISSTPFGVLMASSDRLWRLRADSPAPEIVYTGTRINYLNASPEAVFFAASHPRAGVELFAYRPAGFPDCNTNAVHDRLETQLGWAPDADSNGTPDSCCPADIDADGQRTVQDIFAFLNAWFTNGPRADFDGSGAVGVEDIFVFLSAWFIGC